MEMMTEATPYERARSMFQEALREYTTAPPGGHEWEAFRDSFLEPIEYVIHLLPIGRGDDYLDPYLDCAYQLAAWQAKNALAEWAAREEA